MTDDEEPDPLLDARVKEIARRYDGKWAGPRIRGFTSRAGMALVGLIFAGVVLIFLIAWGATELLD